MLHAAFLRSPHAHARVVSIRTEAAAAMPGVAGVFTFERLRRWMKPLPVFGAPPPGLAARVKFEIQPTIQYALCEDRVRHVGEIVAMVVADSRYRAEDAAERIEVEWEPLPAVVDMIAAAEPGAPRSCIPTCGEQRGRRLHPRHRRLPTRRSPGPTS